PRARRRQRRLTPPAQRRRAVASGRGPSSVRGAPGVGFYALPPHPRRPRVGSGPMRRFILNRLALGFSVAALALAMSAPSATASLTIGQLAPGATTACQEGYDWMGQFLPYGAYGPYVAPASGTITSWSHLAAPGAGQTVKMRIWRVESVSIYRGPDVRAVAHDGPRKVTGGTLNTFPTRIAVKRGDILGLHTDSAGVGCLFAAPGGSVYKVAGDTAEGESFQGLPGMYCGPDCPPPVSD